jgi:hypothetical protein
MGLQIFANIDATQLNTARVISANDLRPKKFKPLAAGDATVVDLFLTGDSGLQNIQDYPTVRLGIGTINARPTSGSFTYGAQTVIFNIDQTTLAQNIDTAITAVNAACTVTSLGGFAFEVNFTANGAQTISAIDAGLLTPDSTVTIVELVAGTASSPAKWLVRLFANPIALVSTFSNISGNGIRGSLNLGTVGVYDLLNDDASVNTTIELELTDSDGNIQTIFQAPLTISGEVVGQGVTGVATFGSYATSSQLVDATTRSNYIFVSAADGSDTNGLKDREDRPFATATAAVATADANDVVVIRDGNFSASSATISVDMTIIVNPAAIAPEVTSSGAVNFTLIGPFESVHHDGTGTATISSAEIAFLDVSGTAGSVYVTDSRISARATETHHAVQVTGGKTIRINDSRITSDDAGQAAIEVSTFTGSFFINDCEVKAAASTGTFAADGMEITSTLTGSVQIKDSTFIGTDGTGTFVAKAIDADTACTVQIQGSLNSNKAASTTVTLDGGIFNENSNYDI